MDGSRLILFPIVTVVVAVLAIVIAAVAVASTRGGDVVEDTAEDPCIHVSELSDRATGRLFHRDAVFCHHNGAIHDAREDHRVGDGLDGR